MLDMTGPEDAAVREQYAALVRAAQRAMQTRFLAALGHALLACGESLTPPPAR